MMVSGDEAKQQRSPRRIVYIAAAALIGVSAGLAGIYGIAALARNPTNPVCAAAAETVQRLGPLSRGEVAAVAVASEPRPVPDLAFRDADGRDRTALLAKVELVDDTRARLALNVSEELALEALAYRLES